MFITEIDGVDIHFIHVRSKHDNALPLIVTHGWPGSIIEQLKIIDPLTNPTAHGGSASDAFHLVIPSMPGFGFSGKPKDRGWNPDRIARAWAELMKRLGYSRYVAQGGDWGSPDFQRDGAPGAGRAARHPYQLAGDGAGGGRPCARCRRGRASRPLRQGARGVQLARHFFKKYRAYGVIMGTRPQAIGYGLADSPVGLAAWIFDYNNGEPARRLNRDDVLDNITLYWLTNTATSAARLYWETAGQSVVISAAQKTSEISLPVAITVFPDEVYRAPESWARRAYRNLSLLQRGRQRRPLRRLGAA